MVSLGHNELIESWSPRKGKNKRFLMTLNQIRRIQSVGYPQTEDRVQLNFSKDTTLRVVLMTGGLLQGVK